MAEVFMPGRCPRCGKETRSHCTHAGCDWWVCPFCNILIILHSKRIVDNYIQKGHK